MTDMETKRCNLCGFDELSANIRKVEWNNGRIDFVEELRCSFCDNLVYGRIGKNPTSNIFEVASRLFGKK